MNRWRACIITQRAAGSEDDCLATITTLDMKDRADIGSLQILATREALQPDVDRTDLFLMEPDGRIFRHLTVQNRYEDVNKRLCERVKKAARVSLADLRDSGIQRSYDVAISDFDHVKE